MKGREVKGKWEKYRFIMVKEGLEIRMRGRLRWILYTVKVGNEAHTSNKKFHHFLSRDNPIRGRSDAIYLMCVTLRVSKKDKVMNVV